MCDPPPDAPVTLDYSSPPTRTPGVPGAIAIISIILASLAIVKSAWVGISFAQDALSSHHSIDPAIDDPPGFAITLTILELIWLVLGVFLLFAGIKALRNNPRAYLLHLLYAIIKIPAVILAAIIEAGLFASDRTDMAMPAFIPVVFGAMNLIYPIALLFILPWKLQSRSIPSAVPNRD
jgi:hypothetical protein